MPERERIADTRAHTGEGPLWHPDDRRLYWVDIPAGELYGYDPARDEYELVYETDGVPIGGYTIEEDGALLLFTHGTVSRLEPGDDIAQPVVEIDAETRFNDVIADPEGRVFCGTMPGDDELGDLYRLEPDGTATVVIESVDIPNGMGFSRNLETFYVTESEAHAVYAFDYDRETGALTNRRTFLETADGDGVPDGMTVDADDHVWSARWDGGRAVRYDPDGRDVDTIDLPARKVASVTFGGPTYEDLYLTTALTDGDRETEGDGAGAVFRVPDVGVSGVPEFRSRIALE
ncbi:SMP-30/gluconolactonase/LRE family protein [Natrialba sp. INN-245]|uniref:SMP-30/gluconolactonase/LRE family protein n=1 Tax=Natrialba sp. INN-245 TaxID=2690967 RepID=UPI0013107D42|nr:SMP-30/gluconolactonase/LRE family protein [Natrialba sp. INN-245]MWV40914.1 SMP-30/gluconolactonase/LRE family protein [Natrialba sp. INN-245]